MADSRYLAQRSNVSVGPLALQGILSVPDKPRGVVVFSHGSGSGRNSPRNQHVAAALHAAGFSTLLLDLLSDDEASARANVFDIALLSERVLDAVRWVNRDPRTEQKPVGLFGASTGAAAALVAAAEMPDRISAVVSRGGRPDLAKEALAKVRAPTLLIVGGADHGVVELNVDALEKLNCVKRLEIVPDATHLFEEAGTLDKVVDVATKWFKTHLIKRAA